MKIAILSGVLCASLIPALAQLPTSDQADCVNVHPHEPVVVYELYGATLSGQTDQSLIVFGDGLMKLSTATPGMLGTCMTVRADPIAVKDLHNTLLSAGAATLCDDAPLYIDMPLHTLTVLSGAHERTGRTFSFWDVQGNPSYASIDAILQNFIATHFAPTVDQFPTDEAATLTQLFPVADQAPLSADQAPPTPGIFPPNADQVPPNADQVSPSADQAPSLPPSGDGDVAPPASDQVPLISDGVPVLPPTSDQAPILPPNSDSAADVPPDSDRVAPSSDQSPPILLTSDGVPIGMRQ